jgi:hypothetical protein
MTNPVPRIYVLCSAILVLFIAWAVIAARPWVAPPTAKADPRLAALARREVRLRHDAVVVRRIVNRRWRRYTIALRDRRRTIRLVERRHHAQLIAAHAAQVAAASAARLAATQTYSAPSYSSSSAAPAVRVVTLPPITVTRSS